MSQLASQLEEVITTYQSLKANNQNYPLYNSILRFGDLKMYKLFLNLINQMEFENISAFDLQSTTKEQNYLFELARKYINNAAFI